MKILSVKECLSFGWNTFWSRPWLFVFAGVIVFLVNMFFSIPQSFLENAAEAAKGSPDATMISIIAFAVGVIGAIVSIFLQMGTMGFFLKAHDAATETRLRDLIHLKGFLRYAGTSILCCFAILIGFVLLIVPGIIVSVALSLALYLVIDKGLGPVAAFKQSIALTKGHRWNLFFLALATVGVNILGLLALVVGLLVSVPVSMLAMMHAYRLLSASVSEQVLMGEPSETVPVAA